MPPPPPIATRDEVRAFDRYAIETLGVPSIALMENAGRQIADAARRMIEGLLDPRVLVLAGRGNNGGDGFVVARHLAIDGIRPDVVVVAPRDHIEGDADINLRILERMGFAILCLDGLPDQIVRQLGPRLEKADLVIDGLLGTGTKGSIREPYASVITAVNAAGRPVLAVDIPSGLDCDTGQPLGPTIRASRTVTMAAIKSGFSDPGANRYTGMVILADIGVPWQKRCQAPFPEKGS
jgi:NAD(P)H-hydrate epimerase